MTDPQTLYDTLYEDADSDVNARVKPGDDYGDPDAAFAYIERARVAKDAAVLEIGFGAASLLAKLQAAGFQNLKGVEVSRVATNRARGARPALVNALTVFDGETLPFGDETFDVVLSFDVIEHIPNVDRHFKEVARILKHGGRYIFQTPNKPVNALASTLVYRSLTAWRPYHCSLQTPGSLRAHAARHGFSVERLEMFNAMTPEKETSIRTHFGLPGVWAYKVLAKAPLAIAPNLWGIFRR